MTTDIDSHRHVDVRPAVTPHDAHEATQPDGTDGFVRWLGDVSHADSSQVGVTGAALGDLARAGHVVPPGFVVTVDAYLRALDQFGGRGALHFRIADVDRHDPSALTRAAKTCQALVRSALIEAEAGLLR